MQNHAAVVIHQHGVVVHVHDDQKSIIVRREGDPSYVAARLDREGATRVMQQVEDLDAISDGAEDGVSVGGEDDVGSFGGGGEDGGACGGGCAVGCSAEAA